MTLFETTIEQISLFVFWKTVTLNCNVYSFLISQKYFIVSNKIMALNKTNIDR